MGNIKTDNSVYADIASLNNWKIQMKKINDAALDTLDSFTSTVEELKCSWCGNSAESFLNSSTKMLNQAKSYHNDMSNVENFLTKVVNTMENQ